MLKKKLLTLFSFFLFVSSLSAGLREKQILKNIEQLPQMMLERGFLPHETAIVFDIDGTLVVEAEPLFNQELVREQVHHGYELAASLGLDMEDLLETINRFRRNEGESIRLVEEKITDIFSTLHQLKVSLMTCTRSVFGLKDHRLDFLKQRGIDFGSCYHPATSESVPFFNPKFYYNGVQDFEKIKFRGHSSAYNSKKSVTIDTILHALKKTRPIKNLIFIDNFDDEVDDVYQNCIVAENVLSLYYTRVREDTKIDDLIESYKRFEEKYLSFESLEQKFNPTNAIVENFIDPAHSDAFGLVAPQPVKAGAGQKVDPYYAQFFGSLPTSITPPPRPQSPMDLLHLDFLMPTKEHNEKLGCFDIENSYARRYDTEEASDEECTSEEDFTENDDDFSAEDYQAVPSFPNIIQTNQYVNLFILPVVNVGDRLEFVFSGINRGDQTFLLTKDFIEVHPKIINPALIEMLLEDKGFKHMNPESFGFLDIFDRETNTRLLVCLVEKQEVKQSSKEDKVQISLLYSDFMRGISNSLKLTTSGCNAYIFENDIWNILNTHMEELKQLRYTRS